MQPSTNLPARLALIVEDQSDTRAWLHKMLAAAFEGITITEASTLRAARGWIAANAAALSSATNASPIALVDIGLPDGSGVDLIRQLAREHRAVTSIVTTICDRRRRSW